MSELRQRVLEVLARGVEPWLERYDKTTGRFMSELSGPPAPGARPEDLGWWVLNQDIIYVLATLYRLPGTIYYGDEAIMEMVRQGGDALREFQDDEGRVEFIKPDGSRWGQIYMCWTNYAWLETLALTGDELGEKRRQSWIEGLTLAHEGQAREISDLFVHNIPAWKGMSCWRAGEMLQRPDWQAAGEAIVLAVAGAQHPEGYWAEHGGPTTLYNHVYVHALGLYHAQSGDERVVPALARAADFHAAFTYPDGVPVETVDGRVSYTGSRMTMGPVGFSVTPRGRRLARQIINCLDPRQDCNSFQGGALASPCHYLTEGPEEPIRADQADYRHIYGDWAVVCKKGPWFGCLSAFVCPPVPSRWGQDRQSFASLWHKQLGLVLGGGNSKDQPEWSTLVAEGRLVPDRGEVLPAGEGVALYYGQVCCRLKLTLEAQCATLTTEVSGGPALHQLIWQIKPGDTVRSAGGREATLGDKPLRWGPGDVGEWLETGRQRVTVPPGTGLHWPTAAFNPYAADGAAAYGAERALLSCRLENITVQWRFATVDI